MKTTQDGKHLTFVFWSELDGERVPVYAWAGYLYAEVEGDMVPVESVGLRPLAAEFVEF